MINQKSGYFEYDGGKIYYETAGSGEPLIFAHAGFVDSRMWDTQWEFFAQHYQVVRFDMVGFGRSSAATKPVNRRDELNQLLNHLEIDRAILVGSSMSGATILDFYMENPERVSALVLVAAVPNGFEMQGAPPAELLEMMGAIEEGDLQRALALQIQLWVSSPHRSVEQISKVLRNQVAEMSLIPLKNDTIRIADWAPPAPLEPAAAYRLNEVSVPTLIVAGSLDNSEVVRAAEVMAAGIANAEKLIVADTAHVLNMEKPQLFNEHVRSFLRDQKP